MAARLQIPKINVLMSLSKILRGSQRKIIPQIYSVDGPSSLAEAMAARAWRKKWRSKLGGSPPERWF